MKTIKVSRARFIEELAVMSENYGSEEWAIYVNDEGYVQARHDSYSNAEGQKYYRILPLYNMADIRDSHGRYPGDKRFDNWRVAEWVVNGCILEHNNNKEISFEMVK